MDTNLKVT